jgi:hypothetical protein
MAPSTIRIFYIHYNAGKYEKASRDPNKARPDLFSYENCFKNLLQSIRQSQHKVEVELTIWFDGSVEDFQCDFVSKNIPTDIKTQVLHGEFRHGTKSCMALVNYIAQAPFAPNDLIYCLENDYSHQMDWLDKTMELVNSDVGFDYLSLYDHVDNYRLPIHQRMNTQLFYTQSQIWKTALSTCWSFLSRHKTFCADYGLLSSNDDFMLFIKLSVIGRRLLVAVPGLSAHGMRGLESPGVDWTAVRAGVH